jgi:hypothetical protein
MYFEVIIDTDLYGVADSYYLRFTKVYGPRSGGIA